MNIAFPCVLCLSLMYFDRFSSRFLSLNPYSPSWNPHICLPHCPFKCQLVFRFVVEAGVQQTRPEASQACRFQILLIYYFIRSQCEVNPFSHLTFPASHLPASKLMVSWYCFNPQEILDYLNFVLGATQ